MNFQMLANTSSISARCNSLNVVPMTSPRIPITPTEAIPSMLPRPTRRKQYQQRKYAGCSQIKRPTTWAQPKKLAHAKRVIHSSLIKKALLLKSKLKRFDITNMIGTMPNQSNLTSSRRWPCRLCLSYLIFSSYKHKIKAGNKTEAEAVWCVIHIPILSSRFICHPLLWTNIRIRTRCPLKIRHMTIPSKPNKHSIHNNLQHSFRSSRTSRKLQQACNYRIHNNKCHQWTHNSSSSSRTSQT